MRRTVSGLRHSLRGRLLAGTLAWIVASVLVAGWALSDLFRQHVERQLVSELTVYMNQLVAALSVDAQDEPALAYELSDPRLQQPYSGLYWQIDQLPEQRSPTVALFHSRSLWDQSFDVSDASSGSPEDGLVTLSGPRDSAMLALVRVVTPPEGTATYRFIVAVDGDSIREPLAKFRMLLAIFLGLLVLGLITAAVVQLVVGLRPLVRLRQRLAEVNAGQAVRIDGRFPNEIQPLVDEFNAALNTNAEIVERARTQAGNLAHALKTPLSVLANGAEQERTPFGQLVSEQVDVAKQQVDYHLARARAAAAVRTPGVRTEVLPVVQGLARVLAQLYAEKGVQLDTDAVVPGFVFKGEQQDLHEMLGNLMENACKWAQRNVSVSASVHGDEAAGMIGLHIDDDGPGLPPAQYDAIFQRGVRMDERIPGSGLGLAIVRDFATAYGGAVKARVSPAGGLGIDLYLPGEFMSSSR